MLDEYPERTSKGIKGFFVASGHVTLNHIVGLGNAIVQDILFSAKINPKRKTINITQEERNRLFNTINTTVDAAIKLDGHYDEFDLLGNKGRYIRIMDHNTKDTPCVRCNTMIQ